MACLSCAEPQPLGLPTAKPFAPAWPTCGKCAAVCGSAVAGQARPRMICVPMPIATAAAWNDATDAGVEDWLSGQVAATYAGLTRWYTLAAAERPSFGW